MEIFFTTKKYSSVLFKSEPENPQPINSPEQQQINIPLSSMEAHNILKQKSAARDIPQIIFNFIQLVDVNNSQLIDLTQSSNQPLNNKQFLDSLIATTNRLLFALMSDTSYPTLSQPSGRDTVQCEH